MGEHGIAAVHSSDVMVTEESIARRETRSGKRCLTIPIKSNRPQSRRDRYEILISEIFECDRPRRNGSTRPCIRYGSSERDGFADHPWTHVRHARSQSDVDPL